MLLAFHINSGFFWASGFSKTAWKSCRLSFLRWEDAKNMKQAGSNPSPKMNHRNAITLDYRTIIWPFFKKKNINTYQDIRISTLETLSHVSSADMQWCMNGVLCGQHPACNWHSDTRRGRPATTQLRFESPWARFVSEKMTRSTWIGMDGECPSPAHYKQASEAHSIVVETS